MEELFKACDMNSYVGANIWPDVAHCTGWDQKIKGGCMFCMFE